MNEDYANIVKNIVFKKGFQPCNNCLFVLNCCYGRKSQKKLFQLSLFSVCLFLQK